MDPYPRTWTFELDERSTHMSLLDLAEGGPVFATPDAVDAVLATFPRTAATPPEVVSLLVVAGKLLRTCVVHYEFAAVAVEKSLQALERAVRVRTGAGKDEKFYKLIERLRSLGGVDLADVTMLDFGRKIRNETFAHPTEAVVLPLVLVTGMLRTSHRLIAGLFPDSDVS